MVPILAYRMQEKEFGGLSHGARRRLREVAASLRTDKPSQERPDSARKPARDFYGYGGETHEFIATGMAWSALNATIARQNCSSTTATPLR
jgi:hypothetical protein